MSGDNRLKLKACLIADLSHFVEADEKDPFARWQAVAVSRQLGSLLKKFEEPNPDADKAAIAKFLLVNERVGTWERRNLPSWDEELLGLLRKQLDSFFHPQGDLLFSDYETLFNEGDVGPGASLLGRGGDFYTKFFSSELTTTSLQLYREYRAAIANLPRWSDAESYRLNHVGGPKVVSGNQLTCVPKNVDISRTICTEPTLNMWFQLGLGNIIRRRLVGYFGIRLESVADVNRELARLGSEYDTDDSFSTIDLESASDSLSLSMLREVLPPWLYDTLIELRSPETRLPDGKRVQLNMVSTMGNGYTFPLQTALFSCVVSAVYEQMGIPRLRVDSSNPTWAVFGDDIIVRRKAYGRVCHLLDLLGFVVNPQKSFREGPFRESCGCDYFKGHNVRPVYIKRLSTQQDIYVAFNKLVRWASRVGVTLHMTMQWLLRQARFTPVPFWESDDAGYKVPLWYAGRQVRNRGGALRYRATVPRQARIQLTDTAITVPSGHRRRVYSPDGLLIAIAKGEFGDGVLVPRQRYSGSKLVRRTALSWDVPPVPDHVIQSLLSGRKVTKSESWMSGERLGPVAGPDEGKRCESAFYGLF